MRIRRILYSSKFVRSFKAIDPTLHPLVVEREKLFRKNAFDPRLRTHKLKGFLKGYWSFSLTYSHRVVFEILAKGEAAFVDIGTHDIYH